MRRSDNVAAIHAAFGQLGTRWPLLVLEEAQNLSASAIEEVRLLTCVRTDTCPPFSLLLIGDDSLLARLQMGIHHGLLSRLGFCLGLRPLDPAHPATTSLHDFAPLVYGQTLLKTTRSNCSSRPPTDCPAPSIIWPNAPSKPPLARPALPSAPPMSRTPWTGCRGLPPSPSENSRQAAASRAFMPDNEIAAAVKDIHVSTANSPANNSPCALTVSGSGTSSSAPASLLKNSGASCAICKRKSAPVAVTSAHSNYPTFSNSIASKKTSTLARSDSTPRPLPRTEALTRSAIPRRQPPISNVCVNRQEPLSCASASRSAALATHEHSQSQHTPHFALKLPS